MEPFRESVQSEVAEASERISGFRWAATQEDENAINAKIGGVEISAIIDAGATGNMITDDSFELPIRNSATIRLSADTREV